MLNKNQIVEALETVMDPEIPTISIWDLGIVTDIQIFNNSDIKVTLTPTFSGCPALKVMEDLVKEKMSSLGINAEVETTYETNWSTERITEKGRLALLKHGLAPPPHLKDGLIELDILSDVACPYCNSRNTSMNTPFGPTLCRSLHYCHNCKQAFEQFKPVD